VKVNNFTTSFNLGDVVVPRRTDKRQLMTIYSIELSKANTGIREAYGVDWHDEYGFHQEVVEPHQIELFNTRYW